MSPTRKLQSELTREAAAPTPLTMVAPHTSGRLRASLGDARPGQPATAALVSRAGAAQLLCHASDRSARTCFHGLTRLSAQPSDVSLCARTARLLRVVAVAPRGRGAIGRSPLSNNAGAVGAARVRGRRACMRPSRHLARRGGCASSAGSISRRTASTSCASCWTAGHVSEPWAATSSWRGRSASRSCGPRGSG